MKTLSASLFAAMLLASPAISATITYTVALSGPAESPPNTSPGTGSGSVVFDTTANTMTLDINFSGLTTGSMASHLHCCTTSPFTGTAGVATTTPSFTGFPLGVTSGTFHNVLDLTMASSWNPAFITASGGTTAGAEASLLAGAMAGEVYWNIHTTMFPGGEIRGFLVAQTPEPVTFALAGIALLGFSLAGRRLKPN